MILGVLLLLSLACLPVAAQQKQTAVNFGRDVQPILREHCYGCHGPSQQMRGLRVDRRLSVMPNRVGANNARIIPGNSAASRLYLALTGQQGGLQMPPAGPLAPAQIETIRTWIDQGADWPDALSGEAPPPAPDPNATRMTDALRAGDRPGFARALREYPEAVNRPGSSGHTPLMYAVIYGGADSVRMLLDAGADPNQPNASKATALMYAVDNVEKTTMLLEKGADVNARSDDGQTALLIAAASHAGGAPVVKLLLDRGADVKITTPNGGTALTAAASSGDPKVLALLLDGGAPKTPLPLAAAALRGCSACVDLLLPDAKEPELTAALTAAVRARDAKLTATLLDRGAKAAPDIVSTLALLAELPPLDQVKTLLERGADINARTRLGGTVLDLAKRQGKTKLVEILVAAGAKSAPAAQPTATKPSPAPSARAAIERSVPPLQRADAAFLRKAGCVSCHNNSLTPMAISAARKSGISVDEQIARGQLRQIAAFFAANGERGLQGIGVPGGIDTAGYFLLGMAAESYPPDLTTDIWARYLKNSQESSGRWRIQGLRPPLEDSDIQATSAALRALQVYGLRSQRDEYQKSVRLAASWLETAQPRTNEDRVFQILGLQWAGARREVIAKAAASLLAGQRRDGGWGQLATLSSDAYATGQALVALAQSRTLEPASPAYQRGIRFLMNTQLSDGSWHVQTRTLPVQRYFDSEFPHEGDQFISTAATNWAVMALAPAAR